MFTFIIIVIRWFLVLPAPLDIHQTSLSLLCCAFVPKLMTPIDLLVVSIGFGDDKIAFICICCNDFAELESGDKFCGDIALAPLAVFPLFTDGQPNDNGQNCCCCCSCCWPVLLLEIDDCGAFDALKLFCDWMLRDLSSGGFLIDDENAKPRRSVALIDI